MENHTNFHDFFFEKSLSNPYYISFNIYEFNCFLDKRFLSFANNNFLDSLFFSKRRQKFSIVPLNTWEIFIWRNLN